MTRRRGIGHRVGNWFSKAIAIICIFGIPLVSSKPR
jgi:hypothetical protein